MTLRRQDLQAAEQAEPRALPHKKTGPTPAPEQPRTGPTPAPDRPRKTDFNLRLDPADYQALQRDSAARGISMASIVRELVHKYLRGLR